MTALSANQDTPKKTTTVLAKGPVKAAAVLFLGGLAVFNAGYLAPGSTATGLVCAGRCKGKVDNSTGSNGDLTAEYETGIFRWANGDSIAQADVGKIAYVVDDATVSKASSGKSPAGVIVEVDANGVWVASSPDLSRALLAVANLASTASGAGASLVSIEDAGAFTATTTVEAALQEIYQDLKSSQVSIPINIYSFREVSASGDVGNIVANGSVLASDTTPIMLGDANNSAEIQWATGNADPIGTSFMLPNDIDPTGNVTLDLDVYSGTTDAATFTVATSWNGGAEVTDTADDSSTKSASSHLVTATIAAADLPSTPRRVTIRLTPSAHATNTVSLLGARLNYRRKPRTS